MRLPNIPFTDDPFLRLFWDEVQKWADGQVDGYNVNSSLITGSGLSWTSPADGSNTPPQIQFSAALTGLSDVTAKTGSGTVVVMQNTPTIFTPNVADLSNMTHSHQNAAGGGSLDAAAIGSGTLLVARQAVTTEYTTNKNTTSGYQGLSASGVVTNNYIPKADSSGNLIPTNCQDSGSAGAALELKPLNGTGGVNIRDGAANIGITVASGLAQIREGTTWYHVLKTASSNGSYTVDSGVVTDFVIYVDANALLAGQNYTINIPAASSSRRVLIIKINKQGAATATITVTPASGNIENAVSKTIAANSFGSMTLHSDGTNWWEFGGVGLA